MRYEISIAITTIQTYAVKPCEHPLPNIRIMCDNKKTCNRVPINLYVDVSVFFFFFFQNLFVDNLMCRNWLLVPHKHKTVSY